MGQGDALFAKFLLNHHQITFFQIKYGNFNCGVKKGKMLSNMNSNVMPYDKLSIFGDKKIKKVNCLG